MNDSSFNERVTLLVQQTSKTHVVLIADESGITTIIQLAEALKRERGITPLVFIESDTAFSLRTRPSTILINGMPDGVIATFQVLDQQGIPARLSSHVDLPGCHDGSALDLARCWLTTLGPEVLTDVELLVIGASALQLSSVRLSSEFGIACLS